MFLAVDQVVQEPEDGRARSNQDSSYVTRSNCSYSHWYLSRSKFYLGPFTRTKLDAQCFAQQSSFCITQCCANFFPECFPSDMPSSIPSSAPSDIPTAAPQCVSQKLSCWTNRSITGHPETMLPILSPFFTKAILQCGSRLNRTGSLETLVGSLSTTAADGSAPQVCHTTEAVSNASRHLDISQVLQRCCEDRCLCLRLLLCGCTRR